MATMENKYPSFIRTTAPAPQQQMAVQGNGQAVQRQKAEFWINVGLPVEGAAEDDKFNFLSLGLGIPLDNVPTQELKGQNEELIQFRDAQNDFRDQLIRAAQKLKPGEARFVELAVQLRRVNGTPESPEKDGNRFIMKLKL